MTKRQNTKKFETELKEHIQEGVYKKICLYYDKQEDTPPPVQSPNFDIEFQGDWALETGKIKLWKNVVYLLFAPKIPTFCTTADKAKEICKKLNEKQGRNCMPRVNDGHFKNPPHQYGRCLYVGSCKDKLHNRMKHHLGKLSGTYGLHLGEWWEKNPIQLFYLIFADNVAPEYLSLIEDVLWEAYMPLFGKKGPR